MPLTHCAVADGVGGRVSGPVTCGRSCVFVCVSFGVLWGVIWVGVVRDWMCGAVQWTGLGWGWDGEADAG